MAKKKKVEGDGIFKNAAAVFCILFLHVLLIAGLGCLVLFFRGVVEYMAWIFAGCTFLIGLSGFLFIRRMKRERKSLGEMLRTPDFQGRSVEVSLFGGIATLKIGESSPKPPTSEALPEGNYHQQNLLEDPTMVRIRELKELALLLEKELITMEEYNLTKAQLFQQNSFGNLASP